MHKLFDLDDVKSKKAPVNKDKAKAAIRRDNFLTVHDRKVETLKELAGRLPSVGECFLIWTIKSFNAFTIIPFLIKEFDKLDYVLLSTYSINIRIIDSLIKKINEGKIEHIKLFISDSIRYRLPKVNDHLQIAAQTTKELTVHYAWNHSKITLIEAGGHFYTFEGSGNWSENAQFEQYIFFNDKKVYDFRKKCITDDLYQRTEKDN